MKVALFWFIVVICGVRAEGMGLKCPKENTNTVSLSLKSEPNQDGIWTAKIRVDGVEKSNPEDMIPINVDVEHNIPCKETERVEIKAAITVPPENEDTSHQKPKTSKKGYELFPGVGYYKMHVKPLIWYDAHTACNREGAHLAVINSQKEANILKTVFARHEDIPDVLEDHYAFVGFHDLNEEGKYETIFGVPLKDTGFNEWEPGQPNNKPLGGDVDQDCGGFGRSGQLADLPCNLEYAFICEHEQSDYVKRVIKH